MRTTPALLGLLLAAPALAGMGPQPCAPTIERGWVRMAPGMPMGAGFAVIRNTCALDVDVVAATSRDFDDVSLHQTRIEDGVSRMREVPAVRVPAGRSVALRPGGLHLMLMAPRKPVAAGAVVHVEFVLRDGRRIGADLPLRTTAP